MPRWIVALLIGLIPVEPVLAGAWLREESHGFLALSGTLRRTDAGLDYETSVYADYGLTRRLTLGVDFHQQANTAGHVLAFVRLPLNRGTRRTRLALELAAGAHAWLGDWQPMARTTLSLGRGFSSRWGEGWFNIDAAYERRFGSARPAIKLDGAVGLSSGGHVRPLLKLETTRIAGHPLYWTVTPAIQIDAGKGGTWIVGVERKSVPQGSIGLRLGLWRRF